MRSDSRADSRPRRPRGSLRGSPLFRLRFGFLAIAMVLSVFGARLVQLQGVDPNAYAEMAAAEGVEDVSLPARRGDILDRNGEPLARSIDGLMVVADPELTADQAPELAKFLANRLDVDYFSLLPRLREEGSRFEYVARRVPSTIATKVVADAAELGFEGLDTRRDPVRDYPARDVAANLVGFMGIDEPLAGFEQTFDAQLGGTDGSARYQVGGGNRLPLGESAVVEPVDGQDLQTTIDQDLQWYTQRVLRQSVEDARADSGFAVVMDTRTGEILSLADHPTFDAADPGNSEAADRGSRAMSDVYEPGSVQKVLTVAGLLDADKVTPRTRIVVEPELRRDGRVINDWFPHEQIKLTLAGVIAKSSNIGTVRAADQYDRGELRRYLTEFGLGSTTGIGVRKETAGILPAASSWDQLVGDRIAFGQSSLGQRRADGRGGQRHRQRRGPRRPLADLRLRHDRRGCRGRYRPRRVAPGREPEGRHRHRPHDGAGRRPRRGHRAQRGRPGLPRGRQDRHRAARRRGVCLLRRVVHRLLRRVRPGRRPAVHRLRGGAEPPQRRRRWLGRRSRVLQDHELRPAALRRPADRPQALEPAARVVSGGPARPLVRIPVPSDSLGPW